MRISERLRCVVVCSLALGLGAQAPAQEVTQHTTADAREDAARSVVQKGIVLAGAMPLQRLVDLCSQRLGVRIDYDPAALATSVTLRGSQPVDDDVLWELTNAMLISRGFATIRAPGSSSLSVVKLAEAAALARIEATAGDADGASAATQQALRAGFVSEMVDLRDATSGSQLAGLKALEHIKPFLSKPGGTATVVGDGAWLLVSDTRARVDQVREVLQRLQMPRRKASQAQIPCENLPASKLIELARDIMSARMTLEGRGEGRGEGRAGRGNPEAGHVQEVAGGELIALPGDDAVMVLGTDEDVAAWATLLRELDAREPRSTQTYATHPRSAAEVGKMLADALAGEAAPVISEDATGTGLVVRASTRQHAIIASMLERLLQQAPPSLAIRTLVVKNRPAEDVASVLESLVQAGALERSRAAQAASQALTSNTRDARSGGAMLSNATTPLLPGQPAAMRASNTAPPALTLTADRATNTIIAAGEADVLAQLDGLLATLDVRQPQVMLEAILVSLSESESVSLGVELERLFTVGASTVRLSSLFGLAGGSAGQRTVGDGAGFTGAVVNPGDFSAVVRALQAVANGRSISQPRVLVNNNEQATFGSVLQQPVGVVTQGNTSTTQSFGGTLDAGTNISVRPQIAEGGHLVLQYNVSLSSFVGASAGAGLPPPRQQNQVSSIATIPDGYAVIVGGLDVLTEGKSEQRVPVLGSIPLVGGLFKNQSESGGKQRFYVFLRAKVLRDEGFTDLRALSHEAAQHDRAGARDIEAGDGVVLKHAAFGSRDGEASVER